MPLLQVHFLDTGYCLASEHHMLRGGARRAVECHALVALLHHPKHGWMLWDTGYAPRMIEATSRWPFQIYRTLTPLRIKPELAAAHQLDGFGLAPGDIKRIIVSHFHADHIAGLRDFPNAEIIASSAAIDSIAGHTGLSALRRAFIPALLPDDFATRVRLLPAFTGPALPALGSSYDLFGDGAMQLVALPGHARGQIGALVQTENGPMLLAADGCWLSRAYRENRWPAPVTQLLVDDWTATVATIQRLHDFAATRPDILIVPTHCPEMYERFVMREA